jgi:CHAP domain
MDAIDILNVAKKELGKQEIPLNSNWGEHVQKYLHSVGIDFPASWCMAFVYWCVLQTKPVNPLVKTGGVMRQWNEIDPKYKVKAPQAGDIFIMDFGKGLGHTGFVESVSGNSMITIEGNATTISGSREGIEVCRKTTRTVSSCKGFIRII